MTSMHTDPEFERLSADDRIMLWGDVAWPQEIGALAVLDERPLPDADGRFRMETDHPFLAEEARP